MGEENPSKHALYSAYPKLLLELHIAPSNPARKIEVDDCSRTSYI